MKTPIEPSEIREGDLIRKEYGVEVGHGELALEYRATSDAHRKGGPGQHYLLDRPTPAVELPIEPTLGWVTDGRSPRLAHWSVTDRGLHLRSSLGASAGGVCASRETHVDNVTAFTPATAVPTEALDELRAAHSALGNMTKSAAAIRAFLVAVGKAGESA